MAIIQANFFSLCLMRTVEVNVILPVDKMVMPGMPVREKKPFKTLYLLHGIFGNYTDWVSGTRIQAWAQEKNLAVVMPSGENHFYVDCGTNGGQYGEFVGKELVGMTRDMFPLSDRREDTYIAGLSMGGYGAIRNGLKYHNTFGCLAGLSSALILQDALASTEDAPGMIGNRNYYRAVFGDLGRLLGSDKDYKALVTKVKEEGGKFPAIYLACGTEDFLYQHNKDYLKFLSEQQVEYTWEEGPGGHTWEFWDTYIKRVLDWLPLEKETGSIHSGNVK